MRPLVLAALLALAPLALSSAAWADLPEAPFAQCRAAIAAAEHSSGVPDRLMQSIGIMESGRRDGAGAASAWPWTINHEGIGAFFATKAEAVAAVAKLQSQGVRSIDVGCMQVNLMHHGSAFSSLEEAFDPGANARYAGQFLNQLLARTGSWPGATAGYHTNCHKSRPDFAGVRGPIYPAHHAEGRGQLLRQLVSLADARHRGGLCAQGDGDLGQAGIAPAVCCRGSHTASQVAALGAAIRGPAREHHVGV